MDRSATLLNIFQDFSDAGRTFMFPTSHKQQDPFDITDRLTRVHGLGLRAALSLLDECTSSKCDIWRVSVITYHRPTVAVAVRVHRQDPGKE